MQRLPPKTKNTNRNHLSIDENKMRHFTGYHFNERLIVSRYGCMADRGTPSLVSSIDLEQAGMNLCHQWQTTIDNTK